MKNILISLSILVVVSCTNNEKDLKTEIARLKLENTKLKSSLKNCEILNVASLQMQLNVNKPIKLNQTASISGSFKRYDEMPRYKLYLVNRNAQIKEKLLLNSTSSHFEFLYKPSSKNDSLLEIKAEMIINDKLVSIPGKLEFIVQ